ncbi:MAG: aminotransferase class IV [Bacteroidales bacterium]|nr:aminotransferase class IV [Bacteroidales bacterium]
MQWTIFNGSITKENEVNLSCRNRIFNYGDGFFETIRIVNGKPVFITDHLERISKALHMLKLSLSFTINEKSITSLLEEWCHLNGVTHGGRVRITFFRDTVGYYIPDSRKCSYLVTGTPLADNFYTLNSKGLSLGLFQQHLKPVHPLFSIKSTNAILYVLAGLHAKENNYDDCLITNEFENIIEATSSNFFMIKGNTIITPGLDEGCVHGIMRKNLLSIIKNNTSYHIKQGIIQPADPQEAEELFITNTIHGIQWVVAWKDKRFFNTKTKMLVPLLNEAVAASQHKERNDSAG